MSKLPIEVVIPVQWGDLDALGHVNNTLFFRWFESARIAYFDAIGLTHMGSELAVGPILAHTSCDFLAPVHFPATIHARVGVTKVGRTSMHMTHELCLEDGTPVAKGVGIVVTVDYASAQSVPVPDAVRAAIEALQA